eukprot:Sspe_Gene.58732::Locus_32236_Transcript_1_1_Confidence_1.000_Length_1521::g.58732::m.58732/K10297/FBXO11; F-box protein 11
MAARDGIYFKDLPRQWPGYKGTARTYFVQKQPRKGYFTSINDAIANAQPYERIEVGQGKYFENVVVCKPIEICAERGADRPEIYSHGVTMTIDTDECHIDGLFIRTGDVQQYAVMVVCGSPSITNCVLENLSVIGTATPNIEKNKITGGKLNGIHVTAKAGGTYQNNTIEGHQYYGVWVEATGNPVFLSNYIQDGEQGQVMVTGQSAIDSEGLGEHDVGPNVRNLQERVAPVFQGNRISDLVTQVMQKPEQHKRKSTQIREVGDRVSLHVSTDKEAVHYVEDARVERLWQDRAAVEVMLHANPVFERNWVSDGLNHGFYFHAKAKGECIMNKITRNAGFGVVLATGANPTIQENDITFNRLGGVMATRDAAGVIERNSLLNNGAVGVSVMHGGKRLKVVDNVISGHSKSGMRFSHGGGCFCEKNDIKQNQGPGVVTETLGAPHLYRNTIRLNASGIVCVNHGMGTFTENEV